MKKYEFENIENISGEKIEIIVGEKENKKIISFLNKQFKRFIDRGRKEDIKSVTHFFDELNQKQYKKKVIDVVAVASIDSKMKHSFEILEL